MATVRYLVHAPITEAVIDFRVEACPGFDVERIREAVRGFSEAYPLVEDVRSFSGGVQFVDGRVEYAAKDHGVNGIVLRAAGLDRVVQFRIDGYTFSKLKPYTDWLTVRDEAVRLWKAYVEAAGVPSITRIAVRYINQFGISRHRVTGALVMSPETPLTFSLSDLHSSLYRFVLRGDSDIRSRVTVAVEPDVAGLYEVLEKCSAPNWDGYGARPVSIFAWNHAHHLLHHLPTGLPAPDVDVDPDGEISFEWWLSRNRSFTVSIGPTGVLSYAGIFEDSTYYGTVRERWSELPIAILAGLRLFQKARAGKTF